MSQNPPVNQGSTFQIGSTQTTQTLDTQALDTYESIDLSPQGPTCLELLNHLNRDLGRKEIYLTDMVGGSPENMTPVMKGWYSLIAQWRQPAVGAVRNAFHSEHLPQGGHGELYEAQCQQIRQKAIVEKRAAYQHHRERFGSEYNRLDKLAAEVNRDQAAYGQMNARLGGRQPIIFNKWLYAGALMLILVAESFVNFEAFLSVKWFTPFTALGATLLVAFAIAAAAHFHGTLLKQFQHYFGEQNRDVNRGPAWKMFSLGSVLLSTALAAVWYARGIHLGELAAINDALGEASDLSKLATVGGSLLLNLIVYLVGIVIAWWAHDAEPEYPKLKKKLATSERELSGLQSKVEKALDRDLRRVKADADKEEEHSKALYEMQKRGQSHERNEELFARLKAKDAQLLAVLYNYRTDLVNQAQAGQQAFFVAREYPSDTFQSLTPDEYQRLEIQLNYI